MKTKNFLQLAASLIILSAVSAPSQGTILFQHTGATDPMTEGFSQSIGGQVQVGPVLSDQGKDAWGAGIGNFYGGLFYTQILSPQQQIDIAGADWAISVTLRVVSSTTLGAHFATFFTGAEAFTLSFGMESNGDPIVYAGNSSLSPMYVLEGEGSTYHNYQLFFDASTGTANLWVDGIERLSGILPGPSNPGEPGWSFKWGRFEGLPVWANWNELTLTVVPEPSSVVLTLLGGGVVLCARHRSMRKREMA